MGTSLDSILDANPELRKAPAPEPGPKPVYEDFEDALSKMGQRHGKKDKAIVQKAHDAMAELVDGIHCAMGAEGSGGDTDKALDVSKRNARHSKKDLEEIKKCHDMIKGLGADCPAK